MRNYQHPSIGHFQIGTKAKHETGYWTQSESAKHDEAKAISLSVPNLEMKSFLRFILLFQLLAGALSTVNTHDYQYSNRILQDVPVSERCIAVGECEPCTQDKEGCGPKGRRKKFECVSEEGKTSQFYFLELLFTLYEFILSNLQHPTTKMIIMTMTLTYPGDRRQTYQSCNRSIDDEKWLVFRTEVSPLCFIIRKYICMMYF